MATPSVHREYERKYVVEADARVPELGPHAEETAPVSLSAVYWDTRDLVLARHKIVLRRREGGSDQGWHIKALDRDGGRVEQHWPLDTGTAVPNDLLSRVRVYVRGGQLIPVARLDTERRMTLVRGTDGHVVAEFCDDRVVATDMRSQTTREWREWEVEFAGDSATSATDREAVLDTLEHAVLAAGASPASNVSKLASALGLSDRAASNTAPAKVTRNDSARDVLALVLQNLVEELKHIDPEVRSGDADAVHSMRAHARRIRSVLSAYGRVFDHDTVSSLRSELQELGRALGAARDPLVLHERARNLVRSQPDKPMHAEVLRRFVREREAEARAAHDELLTRLESPRYFALLEALEALPDAPGTEPYASRSARDELLRGLRKQGRRVRKAMKREHASSQAGREESLHTVRKAARRLRFAAEALTRPPVDVFGARVARVAKSAELVQDTLGDHRDSVLLRRALVDSSRRAQAERVDTFGYGRLHALEQLRGDMQLAAYARAAERLRARTKKV